MCWHKWSNWEIIIQKFYRKDMQDNNGNFIEGQRRYQQRRCIKCGKYQEAKIRYEE